MAGYIEIGASGGGKWFPKAQGEAMCIENRHTPGKENWFYSIAEQCRAENKYMMVTIDIPFDRAFSTTGPEWQQRCYGIKNYLQARGFNRQTCDISVINEPMKSEKAITVETYLWLVDLTCKVFQPDFKVGFGNEEYDLAMTKKDSQGNDFYTAGAKRTKAEKMYIHIQSSMRSPAHIEAKCNHLKAIAGKYSKEIDCNEASYENVADPNGWNTVKYQIKKAKDIGCPHIAIVFLNLDGPEKYKFLTFVWRGADRTINSDNPYGSHWKELLHLIEIERKAKQGQEEDGMKLDEIYKEGSRGIGVKFIQMILNQDMKPDPLLKVDGIWGSKTNAIVLAYQEKYNLSQYGGAIGPNTMQDMIKQYPGIWDNVQYLYAIGVR